MAECKGPFDRPRRSPLSLVVLLRRAIADLVDLIMVFYKKGCCFLWIFVKIKAVFVVCARVMLAGLSARKRGVLVEDRRPNPCVVVVILVVAYRGTWDFATALGVVVKGGDVVWTCVRLQQG